MPSIGNLQRREVDDPWLGETGRVEVGDNPGVQSFFRGKENVLKLTLVIDMQLCEYSKSYSTIYFKWMNCLV